MAFITTKRAVKVFDEVAAASLMVMSSVSAAGPSDDKLKKLMEMG